MQLKFYFSTKIYLSSPINTNLPYLCFSAALKKKKKTKSTYMVFSTSSYFTFKVSWTPTSYATNCLKDFKFYMYQVEFIILSKDPDPLLGLISVNSFPVVNTRYLSIYHVSSLTHPPPFHPVNSNSHASLKSSFLTSIASASLEHLLPSLI